MGRTYGTLRYKEPDSRHERGWWELSAEPYVVVRARRMFAQMALFQQDRLTLSDTPDVARDLEWLMSRYPLKVTPKDQKELRDRVRLYDERQAITEQMRVGKLKPRRFELTEPPYDYQADAAEFFLKKKSLLLADDMGLGKTVTTICAFTEPGTRPALVVAPKALGRQWVKQINRFAPSLRVHLLKHGNPDREDIMPHGQLPDVIVSTYHKLQGWATLFGQILKMIAFDEAQELRHGEDTNKGKAAKYIADRCEYKLELTGTPIYNMGGEFFWVLEYVFPGALGTRSEFLREWCSEVDGRGRSKLKDPKAFGDHIRTTGMMLRRTRADVKRELPGLSIIPHTIDSDPEPLKDIENAAMRLARIIVEGTGKRTEQFLASEELSVMVRKATGIAKAPYVAEFVNLLLESEEKILLFGHHHDVYSIWRERLREHHVRMFTGKETDVQKREAEEAFIKGDARVLIMGVRMAAGFDGLQHVCRTGVIGEPDYSPGVHEQCYTRLARDGQKDPVAFYFPLAEDGSDPIIADLLQVKRAQLEGVRSQGDDLITNLQGDGSRIRKLAEFYLEKERQKQRRRA